MSGGWEWPPSTAWDKWRSWMLAHSGWTTKDINAGEFERFRATSDHTYGGAELCRPCTEQATIACACIRNPIL